MPRVWIVRAGGGELTDEFVEGSHISFGWDIEEDITNLADLAEIESVYRRFNPKAKRGSPGRIAKQIYAFLHEVRAGDDVLTPTSDHKWLRHGIVAVGGPYWEVAPYDNGSRHGNRRPIEWKEEMVYRYDCDPSDQRPMRSFQTVNLVSEDSESFWKRVTPGSGKKAPTKASQRIKPSVRKEVEKLKVEFTWEEAQLLVADLLSAMGYEILDVSSRGPDGGVDIRAVSSNLLTPDVPLAVQVKWYQWKSKVYAKAVRELRAGVKSGGGGVFVTASRFAPGATKVATDSDYPYIALIDGPRLLTLLNEHWDGLSEEFQQRLENQDGIKASTQ